MANKQDLPMALNERQVVTSLALRSKVFIWSGAAWWWLPQEAGAGAAVGDCADLRQDGPGPRHGAGDAPHDDHEEKDAEEEDEKQN